MKPLLRGFPVFLGLVALLFYLVTLSRGITVGNLELAEKISGWDWRPWVGQPLLWLLTLPLRFAPESWVPALLNFFSAVCAAGTLTLLARSLELLVWANPPLTITGWRQRLPLALAVLACGLELNFWQHATTATGEMLGVLLLAGAICCLLKFRTSQDPLQVDQNLNWLHAAVFIWGLGMAENWMMILTLPVFVVIIFAMQPFRLFEKQFILRLAVWGLAGFSIFVVVPLANGLNPGSPLGFKASWIASLQHVHHIFGTLFFYFFRVHHGLGFVLLAYYLMPLVVWLLCRFNDEPMNRPTMEQLQIFLFRGLRFVLLLVCLWAMLDPVYGPRSILKNQIHFELPLLSYDYLMALGAGLAAGNLLLAGQRNTPPSMRPIILDHMFAWQEKIIPMIVPGAMVLAVTLLTIRNYFPVTQVNRQPMEQFGELAVRALPPGGGLILSDFADRLVVFHAAQSHHTEARDWIPVDVGALSSMEYRAWLDRKYPNLGVPAAKRRDLTPAELRNWIDRQFNSRRVFYLHPSSGYFFEAFYLVPKGVVYQMKPFVSDLVSPPPLSATEMADNEKLWLDAGPRLDPMQATLTAKAVATDNWFASLLRLEPVDFVQGDILKSWYSAALNGWGVQLQRAGQLPAAQGYFLRATDLNDTNWIAHCNYFSNTNLQAGNSMDIAVAPHLAERITDAGVATALLSRFGPADEPAFCFALGNAFALANFSRQAMQQFERSAELAPAEPAPKFALITLYTRTRLASRAAATITQLHQMIDAWPATNAAHLKLSLLEAGYYQSQTNLAQARQILDDLIQNHLDDSASLESVVKQFILMQDLTNAEAIFNRQLASTPDNPFLLQAKSELLIQSGQAAAAIPLLNHLLDLTNYPPAKFNRAIAFLRVTNYAAAQADFLDLTNASPDIPSIEYGLAESALGFGETNMAIQYLNRYLAKVPRNSAVWNKAVLKLKDLNHVTD